MHPFKGRRFRTRHCNGAALPASVLSRAETDSVEYSCVSAGSTGQPGLEPGIAGFGDRCLSQLGHCPRTGHARSPDSLELTLDEVEDLGRALFRLAPEAALDRHARNQSLAD